MMEYIFAKSTSVDQLRQGDILIKNDNLVNILKQAHQYYAEALDYTHFVVLTQSCDLVLRGKRKPKSRYITVAAIRPLRVIMKQFIDSYTEKKPEYPFPILKKENESAAKQLMERFLNNTEPDYFFIKAKSIETVDEDSCCFLKLSVSLRASHYEDILRSKVGEMNDIFAAKLGWLTGNIYSRVGTPDIEDYFEEPDKIRQKFYEETLFGSCLLMSHAQSKALEEISKLEGLEKGEKFSEESFLALAEKLPDDMELISEQVRKTVEGQLNAYLNVEKVRKIIEFIRDMDKDSELTKDDVRNVKRNIVASELLDAIKLGVQNDRTLKTMIRTANI